MQVITKCSICNKYSGANLSRHMEIHDLSSFPKIRCACGCGEIIKPGNKYIWGHDFRNKPRFDLRGKSTGLSNGMWKIPAAMRSEIGKKGNIALNLKRKINSNFDNIVRIRKSNGAKKLWASRSVEYRKAFGQKISVAISSVDWVAVNKRKLVYRFSYKGIKFMSGYEVEFAKFFDLIGLSWVHEPTTFKFTDEDGKKHKYTPDFYLPQLNIFIEVKGWIKGNKDLWRVKLMKRNIPLILLGIKFIKKVKGYTEPSQVGNGLKGVETRPYCLKLLLAMTMKAHERTPSNWMMIWSELTGNSKNSEINSSEDNSDVNLQKIHGMILADEGIYSTCPLAA